MRQLCIKAVSGNIESKDEEILKSWLAESNTNRQTYEEVKKIWANSTFTEVAQIPDIDLEWLELEKRIEVESEMVIKKDSILSKISSILKPVFEPKWKPALGFAVVALLIFSVFIINREPQITKNITASTINKEHKIVRLADGTTVMLNNNSSLIYPESFNGEKREVTLSGEAFFSVTKDTRPFIISTRNAKTTVLGTKFDVWARGEKTRVFVKEGRVNLAANQNDNGVILTKNQSSTVIQNMKASHPKQVQASYLLGWMDNNLVFDKSPLNDVVDELGRFYDVKLALANESLKTVTLSGSFKNGSIDSALTMICLALDLRFEKENGEYILTSKVMNK